MPRVLPSTICASVLLLAGVSLPALSVPAAAQASFRIGYDFFHNRLAHQGRWFRHPVWGDVWRPRPALVGADFQPYTNGYWELTDEYGWYWVSEDQIDDVVYHYGRWVYDPMSHWLWVPGYTWAPAWVLWREGDDYTGWMPLPPDEDFISGTGFGVRLGPIGLNFYRNWYGGRVDPDRFFVFVQNRHLVQRDYRRFVVPRDRVKIVLGRTRPITKFEIVNNRVVNRGIDVRVIERAAGRRIAPVSAKAVIKANAVVTTVDEGKQIRVRERAAHPIDVNAARRANAGRGDAGTVVEPTDRGGPAAGTETGNGRMSNPSGESMTGPSTGQPGKTRGRAGDSNGRMSNPSGESMTSPSTERSGKNRSRDNAGGAGAGSSESGSMPSTGGEGAGGTIRHRPGGTTAEPGTASGNTGGTEGTNSRQRNRSSTSEPAMQGTTPPNESRGAMSPRPARPSTEPSTGSASPDAEQKDKRKPKKPPEAPASPQ